MSKKFDLAAINGRAKAHTFNNIAEIEQIFDEYEKKMLEAGLSKRDMQGAHLIIQSGSPVNSAYKQKCKGFVSCNKVVAIRGAKKWRIESIEKIETWPNMIGWRKLTLTDSQRGNIATVCFDRLDSTY